MYTNNTRTPRVHEDVQYKAIGVSPAPASPSSTAYKTNLELSKPVISPQLYSAIREGLIGSSQTGA